MKRNNVRVSLFTALCFCLVAMVVFAAQGAHAERWRQGAIRFRRGLLQKGNAQVTLERFGSELLLKPHISGFARRGLFALVRSRSGGQGFSWTLVGKTMSGATARRHKPSG